MVFCLLSEFEFFEETALQKLKRRLREEPLIPLGMVPCFFS